MHERQAALAVVSVLFFSVMFSSESFAQVPQCNGHFATIVGTEDKDKIRGTSGDDVIVGLGGSDTIYGMGGNDIICGGEGNDKLYGNDGNDVLLGEKDNNKLYGGKGIDTCDSSSYDKRVVGCEVPYIQTAVSNVSSDLQKQIVDIQNKLNNVVLGLISWTDIQGIPESLADGDDDMLNSIKCAAEQILVFDGNSWVCNDILVDAQSNTGCNGDLVNFAGLAHGDTIEDIQTQLSTLGITVSASGNGDNPLNTVIIYDSNNDDGKDSDLEVGIGNLIIIPDKIESPSDSAKGGKQIYDFSPPKNVDSLVIVDIESDEAGSITAYNSEGKIISSLKLPETGNKSYQTVNLGAKDVAKLVIEYNSSGALTDICISENVEDVLELECSIDQILSYDGEKWVCIDMPENSSTPTEASSSIFFHHGLVASGQKEWVGAAIQIFDPAEMDKAMMIMPTSGTISNLFVKTGSSLSTSPGLGEFYKMTLLVNGQESTSSLTCTIADDEISCSDKINKINVNEGDSFVLQIEASKNAPFAIISSSVLLT